MKILPQSPICGIYKITNKINGMSYIGQSRQIAVRWSQHKHDMKYGGGNNPYLYRALRKYGIQNFSFEILEECKISCLDELECKYIASYNSLYPNGYNLERGGWATKEIAKETRLKISLSKRGTISPKRIPVNQYTKNGEYIHTFSSMSAAASYFGVNSCGHIADCCTKKRMFAYGFQWRYSSGNDNIEPAISHRADHLHILRSIPVSQFSKNGGFITSFPSASRASQILGVSASSISRCCKIQERYKSAGGFIWRYAE